VDFVAVMREILPFFEGRKVRYGVIGVFFRLPEVDRAGSSSVRKAPTSGALGELERPEPLDLERTCRPRRKTWPLRQIREPASFVRQYRRFLSRLASRAVSHRRSRGREPFE
jgi:hypothetical protein